MIMGERNVLWYSNIKFSASNLQYMLVLRPLTNMYSPLTNMYTLLAATYTSLN